MTGTTLAMVFVVALVSALELRYPDQALPKTKHWWQRVLMLQGLVLMVVTLGMGLVHALIPEILFTHGARYFSPFWGGVVSYLFGTFIFYWWHRARHEVDLLWRLFHQMHHAPERVQGVTAFYVHPFEVVVSSTINAILVLGIFGLTQESLLWNSLFMSLAGVFYHMNLKTPRWVGCFLQRPEMHRFHHERDVHGRNYGDVPWWDMIFGTHWNPKSFNGICGFANTREEQFAQILMFKDVNRIAEAEAQTELATHQTRTESVLEFPLGARPLESIRGNHSPDTTAPPPDCA
jgi:sterol desaturase/sphingolipid hydroxylase (fatty acid hydroxylase superfamily)